MVTLTPHELFSFYILMRHTVLPLSQSSENPVMAHTSQIKNTMHVKIMNKEHPLSLTFKCKTVLNTFPR